MSESKHTPGPWKLDGGKGKRGQLYVWSDRDEQGKGYIGTHEICVTIVQTNGQCEGDAVCWEEETEANARLIAAAPELLEALEAVMWHLDARLVARPDEHAQEALTQARAAIAKAKGER